MVDVNITFGKIGKEVQLASTADLMALRLAHSESKKGALHTSSLYTSDAVAYGPNGKFKILPRSSLLGFGTDPLSGEYWSLAKKGVFYGSIEGREFSRDDLHLGIGLTRDQAKENPVWLALAGDDRSLLENYVGYAFGSPSKYGGISRMRLSFSDCDDGRSLIIPLCLSDGSELFGYHAVGNRGAGVVEIRS